MNHLQQGSLCPPWGGEVYRLYSMRFCPFAHRARLVLSAKEISHEIVNVHLRNKPDWYLKKNALGKVPLIETKDGKIVYESLVICDYLDELYPNNKLNPSDPYLKAWDRILLEVFGQACGKYGKILFHQGDAQELAQGVLDDLKVLEEHLANRKTVYFDGDEKPGFFDYMIWPWFERFPVVSTSYGVNLNLTDGKFPSLIGWRQNMYKDNAVLYCMVPANVHVAYMDTVKEGKTNFDVVL